MRPVMTAMVHDILAEQLLDSFEKAAVISGRTPQAEGRKQPVQCLPEERLISGTDDPEHTDREVVLQSLFLNITGEGITEDLQSTLRRDEDWEGHGLLEDLGHSDQDHRWLWECAPRVRWRFHARMSAKLFS